MLPEAQAREHNGLTPADGAGRRGTAGCFQNLRRNGGSLPNFNTETLDPTPPPRIQRFDMFPLTGVDHLLPSESLQLGLTD